MLTKPSEQAVEGCVLAHPAHFLASISSDQDLPLGVFLASMHLPLCQYMYSPQLPEHERRLLWRQPPHLHNMPSRQNVASATRPEMIIFIGLCPLLAPSTSDPGALVYDLEWK